MAAICVSYVAVIEILLRWFKLNLNESFAIVKCTETVKFAAWAAMKIV